MITEAVVSVPLQPTRWRGLKMAARFSITLLPVLNQPALLVLLQPVLRVLLQTVRGAVMLVAVLVRPLPEQGAHLLSEQEEHLLSEQVPELVTDGQEHQSEAPHRVMPMLQTVLLPVVTTPHVLPQRVERVQPELVVIVQPGHARLAVTLTHLFQVVHSLKFGTTSWETV